MENSEVIKIGIIAGEHSGDLIGSKLIEQIQKQKKYLENQWEKILNPF